MPPKVIITDPTPLKASEGAKSAAKLRSKSKEAAQLPKPELGDAWAPTSWQSKPITQDVVYDDYTGVEAALEKLESLPPLVSPFEIEKLRTKLADAANGKAFVLQGGDCAELFDYCTQDRIEAKLKVLMQMSLVLLWGTGLPVVRIGRIAGQYAKPRSKLTEEVDGKTINSFRGDNINGFDVSDRKPDPARLVSSYFHSAATLNYIRCVLASGFADLRKVDWSLEHVQNPETKERYQKTLDAITEGLQFMHTIGADTAQDMQTIDFFTSHEALLLEYEQSLTREANGHHYNTSAHFIWIGDRTRQLDGAHVEFFRGVRNPIGIKVGPTMQAEELVRLLDIVDSNCEDGRVTLITRYGASKVKELLPAHIKAVQSSGHKVVWMSDPCHGNTQTSTVTKLKTRHVDDIVEELRQALAIHRECGSKLNGAHLELTGDAVTECIGGSAGLVDEDLVVRYDTVCDPRLSLSQSLDVSFLIADSMRAQK